MNSAFFKRFKTIALSLKQSSDEASVLLQILGILSRRKQEERKSRNQDFKAAPAWSISSGQMESDPGALPGFKCWMTAVNSLCEKLSEIFTASGVVAPPKIRHFLMDKSR